MRWLCIWYWLAGHLLAQNPKKQKALLIAGDVSTHCLGTKDSSTVPLFSDAVSATLLSNHKQRPMIYFSLQSDASKRKLIALQKDSDTEAKLYMDGMGIFHFAIEQVCPHLKRILDQAPWHRTKIDYLVCHQASRIVCEALRSRLGLSEAQCPYSLREWGNTSSASIPMTLLQALSSELRSHSKRLILCGFGTGLCWGSMCWESQPMDFCASYRVLAQAPTAERPLVSVIVAVYEAEHRLEALVSAIDQSLKALNYELILVDDASKDKSWELIQHLSEGALHLSALRVLGIGLHQNIGQHMATYLGLTYGRGRYLVTLDDDLQHRPQYIHQLLSEARRSGAEAVYGTYNQDRSWGSKLLGSLLYATKTIRTSCSSFRLLSDDLVRKLQKSQCSYIFLEALIAAQTARISTCNLRRGPTTRRRLKLQSLAENRDRYSCFRGIYLHLYMVKRYN